MTKNGMKSMAKMRISRLFLPNLSRHACGSKPVTPSRPLFTNCSCKGALADGRMDDRDDGFFLVLYEDDISSYEYSELRMMKLGYSSFVLLLVCCHVHVNRRGLVRVAAGRGRGGATKGQTSRVFCSGAYDDCFCK